MKSEIGFKKTADSETRRQVLPETGEDVHRKAGKEITGVQTRIPPSSAIGTGKRRN